MGADAEASRSLRQRARPDNRLRTGSRERRPPPAPPARVRARPRGSPASPLASAGRQAAPPASAVPPPAASGAALMSLKTPAFPPLSPPPIGQERRGSLRVSGRAPLRWGRGSVGCAGGVCPLPPRPARPPVSHHGRPRGVSPAAKGRRCGAGAAEGSRCGSRCAGETRPDLPCPRRGGVAAWPKAPRVAGALFYSCSPRVRLLWLWGVTCVPRQRQLGRAKQAAGRGRAAAGGPEGAVTPSRGL